ncbi:MAG: FMN-binding negative transcriptional regulator [Actinomycetota bacterium]|nr:FMN-binding negative transcriptional regulator [Actinomycetota bacterium]
MRDNPDYDLTDPAAIKLLIQDNPFVTLVSATSNGLVASHTPVIIDESRPELSVLSHLGRPDEQVHELGEHEVLMIVSGPHGYVSPGWYGPGPEVPTWNFVVAHLSGVPEILDAAENYRTLGALVDTFEDRLPEPRRMEGTAENAQYAQRISAGTVGFRLTPTRVTAKAKLSQGQPAQLVGRVIDALESAGPYAQPALAATMRRAHGLT